MNGNEEYGRLEIRIDQYFEKQLEKLRWRIYQLEKRVTELEEAQSKTDSTSKS